MKTLRSIEKEIDKNDPFKDCSLDREKYADNLTKIIENYPTGFVLALNNRWGDGKTFFIDRWRTKLKEKEKFKVVYYNAWEDDFSENALVSIISEITEDMEITEKKFLDNVLERGTGLFVKSIPLLLKIALKKLAGSDGYEDLANLIGEEMGKPFQSLIDEYKNHKKSVAGFKEALKEFAQNVGNGKPIVFFIDELDRCKPSYAVEVLEIIKHLFSVDNIVFVLSVDKEQLANSVRGYYGSDNIDGVEYLRRFIDLEFTLPKPELKSLINSSFNEFKFDDFYKPFLNGYHQQINEKDSFISFCIAFFESKNLKIREIIKLLIKTRTVLYTFNESSYSIPSILLLLIYLHSEENQIFQEIKLRTKDMKEILEINKKQLSLNKRRPIPDGFLKQEFLLYSLYNNYIQTNVINSKIYENTKEGFKANFENASINWESLYSYLTNDNSIVFEADFSLEFLLNKIELSENLNFLN